MTTGVAGDAATSLGYRARWLLIHRHAVLVGDDARAISDRCRAPGPKLGVSGNGTNGPYLQLAEPHTLDGRTASSVRYVAGIREPREVWMRRAPSGLMLVGSLLPNTLAHLGTGPAQAPDRETIHQPGSACFAVHRVAG